MAGVPHGPSFEQAARMMEDARVAAEEDGRNMGGGLTNGFCTSDPVAARRRARELREHAAELDAAAARLEAHGPSEDGVS